MNQPQVHICPLPLEPPSHPSKPLQRQLEIPVPIQQLSVLHMVDSDAGRDRGQEEKGTTEDEMAGWHHRLDGREFE